MRLKQYTQPQWYWGQFKFEV